jgi:hypothetical protein
VFQPGNSLAFGNLLKGNPFTGPPEVEVSLCEKCRLGGISHNDSVAGACMIGPWIVDERIGAGA